jgi:hypothetical protein
LYSKVIYFDTLYMTFFKIKILVTSQLGCRSCKIDGPIFGCKRALLIMIEKGTTNSLY